ncbi:MAG: hypothetical protein AB7K24_06720 [Gemmataceae bacterium]
MKRITVSMFTLLAVSAAAFCQEAEIAKIKAVGPEGEGNEAAQQAWRAIVAKGPQAMLPVLAGLDHANPRAANYLRTAVEAIGEQALAGNKKLDGAALEKFVLDTKHSGPGRRLAYDWLVKIDPKAPERLLPGMLDDPGAELRRDAITLAMADAQKVLDGGNKDAATVALKKLMPFARDRDQVDDLAKKLKDLGVNVDLQKHYGIINRWVLLTTFDNVGMKGFDVAYAPEKDFDLSKKYEGKAGKPARFIDHTTDDPHGKVDLNTVIGKEKGAVAYAYAEIDSPAGRPVEVRVGSINAVKIFLNGKQIFFHHEYHHGMKMDQYVGVGELKKGKNEVLLKICQNEQTENWAQNWTFQARLCDAIGGAVPFKIVTPPVK